MRSNNSVNGKQVIAGCLIFILMIVIVNIFDESIPMRILGFILLVVLFLLGAFLTGAFKE